MGSATTWPGWLCCRRTGESKGGESAAAVDETPSSRAERSRAAAADPSSRIGPRLPAHRCGPPSRACSPTESPALHTRSSSYILYTAQSRSEPIRQHQRRSEAPPVDGEARPPAHDAHPEGDVRPPNPHGRAVLRAGRHGRDDGPAEGWGRVSCAQGPPQGPRGEEASRDAPASKRTMRRGGNGRVQPSRAYSTAQRVDVERDER